ncbi:MFS transporter [Treponema phagedenis]|uniref:MFS transporter n=1 Tax=Treponema phagedenis TaxID=162 RepID=UPI0018CDBFB6|nr:MFS transporter [Treponema phagedenis]
MKKVLLFLMIVFSLGNLCTAFAPTYSILTLSRIIVALVSGAAISVAMAIGSHLAPINKRAWLIAWLYSGFSVASVFGVPLGTWLSDQFGWNIAFYLITAIVLSL